MKVSKAAAAEHRAALLAAASRLFREKGFDKVGIAEIAAGAGLTHGAFYTHFASKEALCAEAIEAMACESVAGMKAAPDLDTFVAAYLTSLHVAARGDGCAFAALSGDAARESTAIRSAFSQGVDRLIDSFADALGHDDLGRAAARARAITLVAALIGGLLLARNAATAGLREEILSAVKASLGAPG